MKVILVPEPHLWDKIISTIFRSREWGIAFMQHVYLMVQTYREQGEEVWVILMGDVFHQGFSSGFDHAFDWYDYFFRLFELTQGHVYSLVGNHEFTYAKDNPFWRLADIQSPVIAERPAAQKYSESSLRRVIKVPDTLRIGGLEILFWHFDTSIADYTTTANDVVIVSHQSLLDKECSNLLKTKYSRDQLDEIIDYASLRGYTSLPKISNIRHMYNGHMHSAYSKFHISEVIHGIPYDFDLQYMASGGRTKAIEVRNDDLIRTLPVLDIQPDGKYQVIETTIQLPGEEVLNQKAIKVNKDAYKRTVQKRELKRTYATVGDPIAALYDSMSEDDQTLSVLLRILESDSQVPELEDVLQILNFG